MRDDLESTSQIRKLTEFMGKDGKPLTTGERKGAAKLKLIRHTERSNNWIAQECGINDETVKKLRDDLESTSDIRKLTEFMGKDGKVRPREMPKAQGKRTDLVAACNQVDDTPTLSELGINKTESHRWQQIASVPEEKFEEYIETANEITQAGLLRIARGSNGEPLPEFEAEAKGRQKHYARTHSRSDDQESGSENLSRDQAARVFGVSGPRLDE